MFTTQEPSPLQPKIRLDKSALDLQNSGGAMVSASGTTTVCVNPSYLKVVGKSILAFLEPPKG